MDTITLELPFLSIVIAFLVCLLGWPLWYRCLWWACRFDKRYQKLLHQKKSSEVRTGYIAESVAPLLELFPVEIGKAGTSTQFLGQPIDYLYFDPEEGITFIEVKSGNARLTQAQRKFKEHVERGNVFFESVQIGRTGRKQKKHATKKGG